MRHRHSWEVVSSERWAEAEEATYFDELNSKAKAILDTRKHSVTHWRADRQQWQAIADHHVDSNAGDVIMNCMLRG